MKVKMCITAKVYLIAGGLERPVLRFCYPFFGKSKDRMYFLFGARNHQPVHATPWKRKPPKWSRPPPFYSFSELYLRLLEVPRLGVESDQQLLAYTTATAIRDPSHIFDLHCSLGQRQILNPPSQVRDHGD